MDADWLDTAVSPPYQRVVAGALGTIVQGLLEWRGEARAAGEYQTADRILALLSAAEIRPSVDGARLGALWWRAE